MSSATLSGSPDTCITVSWDESVCYGNETLARGGALGGMLLTDSVSGLQFMVKNAEGMGRGVFTVKAIAEPKPPRGYVKPKGAFKGMDLVSFEGLRDDSAEWLSMPASERALKFSEYKFRINATTFFMLRKPTMTHIANCVNAADTIGASNVDFVYSVAKGLRFAVTKAIPAGGQLLARPRYGSSDFFSDNVEDEEGVDAPFDWISTANNKWQCPVCKSVFELRQLSWHLHLDKVGKECKKVYDPKIHLVPCSTSK